MQTLHLSAYNLWLAFQIKQSQTVSPEVLYFYSHDIFHCFGFNKNGDWVQLGNLQPFDRITRNIKNAMFTLKNEREGKMALSKV